MALPLFLASISLSNLFVSWTVSFPTSGSPCSLNEICLAPTDSCSCDKATNGLILVNVLFPEAVGPSTGEQLEPCFLLVAVLMVLSCSKKKNQE